MVRATTADIIAVLPVALTFYTWVWCHRILDDNQLEHITHAESSEEHTALSQLTYLYVHFVEACDALRVWTEATSTLSGCDI